MASIVFHGERLAVQAMIDDSARIFLRCRLTFGVLCLRHCFDPFGSEAREKRENRPGLASQAPGRFSFAAQSAAPSSPVKQIENGERHGNAVSRPADSRR
jgi:hypothetical protein